MKFGIEIMKIFGIFYVKDLFLYDRKFIGIKFDWKLIEIFI